MTRLSKHFEVVFVEEPKLLPGGPEPSLATELRDGVTILTPQLSQDSFEPGFGMQVNPVIRELIAEALGGPMEGSKFEQAIVWYWTPMAWGACPVALDDALVIHDVMDELANFRFAPASIEEMEAALLARADLVFTGGPSLYDKRKSQHPDIHCFPSAVDVEHFAQASELAPPSDLPIEPGTPVIGYYGVLDERLDLSLIAGIAHRRPDWNIVLIGPVAKISDADLPQGENIHYLGQRDYADLPAYLAGFDVAILPFAENEATRFISPTKTLEYLAGGKPVVSTPIQDVLRLYGEAVSIASRERAFVQAIESILEEPASARREREDRVRHLLANATWDRTVERMLEEIDRKREEPSSRLTLAEQAT